MVDKYQFYNVTKFFLTNRLLPDLEKNIFHVRFINEINFAEFFSVLPYNLRNCHLEFAFRSLL